MLGIYVVLASCYYYYYKMSCVNSNANYTKFSSIIWQTINSAAK